jgi:hypothetical protein
MQGGDLFKRKSPAKSKINKESPKRKKENKTYLQRLSEKWEQSLIDKTNKCVFCGKTISRREANHHVRGRGAYMLEEEFWRWAHHDCHNAYTFKTMEEILELGWWNDYLARMREIDISTYYKDLRREQKYNEELNFENN